MKKSIHDNQHFSRKSAAVHRVVPQPTLVLISMQPRSTASMDSTTLCLVFSIQQKVEVLKSAKR